jgi:hypothetical protein
MSTIDIVWVFVFQRKSNAAVTLAVACKCAVQDRRARSDAPYHKRAHG